MRKAWLTIEGKERIELTRKLLVGRGTHCDLVITSNHASREHGLFAPSANHWLYTDLGSAGGTYLGRAGVNWGQTGRRVVRLEHGDVLSLSVPKMTFEQEPRADDPVLSALEEAVVSSPEDATRWAVYADRLLELGDARGQRIIDASEDWQSWGWPLAEALRVGALTWQWGFGHLRSATLRRPPEGWTQRAWPLSELLSVLCHAPEARFLVELGLDLEGSYGFEHVRKALSQCHLPALRVLRVTPSPGESWSTVAKTFQV